MVLARLSPDYAVKVVKRGVGLLRAVDTIHAFRRYTTLIVLLDLLRHGSQYLALGAVVWDCLFSPRRDSLRSSLKGNADLFLKSMALAGGLFVTLLSQALLTRLLRGCRLSVANLLSVGKCVTLILAILFSVLMVSDLAALTIDLDVHKLQRFADRLTVLGKVGIAGRTHLGYSSSFVNRLLAGVAAQTFVRIVFVLGMWRAHQRRTSKMLP
eukprot:TRINITY_DN20457_c0_g1_i1.p1 TRINITY_DN20457_c0_g1~~TRINITY_DN20457_c0_g1_i1.p1  ORF type:complete len:212 (+),score=37.48 TRINITY_DN20457_c0_g1_i1:139-774(+)